MSVILTAQHLQKSFTNKRNVTLAAIDNISLTVAEGEFLCIVGPSGCGKTTLLRILAGLETPDSGTARFREHRIQQPRPEIGLVFQTANLMPWRTVLDNVKLPLQIERADATHIDATAHQALTTVGLSDFLQAYPHELSGGMQQRVAIARALVQQPEVLLLDEPFGALDALTREQLNTGLMELWAAAQKTIVLVTHNIREAVFLADRVMVMSRRPGTLRDIFPINIPRPRNPDLLYDPQFIKLAHRVRQSIG